MALAHLRHGLYWTMEGFDFVTLPDRRVHLVRRTRDDVTFEFQEHEFSKDATAAILARFADYDASLETPSHWMAL